MKFYISELFQEEQVKVKLELSKANYIAVTTDMWTSKTNSSFTGLTGHFWSEAKECLVSRRLDCARFFGSHTSEAITSELDKMLHFFDIKEKVVSATADHASNEKKAIKDLGINYIGCYAHDLNLVVQDAIKSSPELTDLREKVSEVVTITRRSPPAKDRFEACQKTAGYPDLRKLKQHVPHRWNSLYEMLQRFLDLKSAVVLFLADETSIQINSENWSSISALVHILKPLYDVTTELCAEKHTSVSKVIPLTKILKSFYGAELKKVQPEKFVYSVIEKVLTRFSERFEHVEVAHILALATLLDPRYKTRGFERHDRIARGIQILKDEALFEFKKQQIEVESQTHEPPAKQKKVTFNDIKPVNVITLGIK
jgi:hypothetical protein